MASPSIPPPPHPPNDQDYNQMQQPGDDYSDDSDPDDDRYDAIYGDLDLQRVYGKQLVVWTHRHAETIALYTPVQGDTFVDIVRFARSSLQFNTAVDKVWQDTVYGICYNSSYC